ncbi:MAG TPA: hypothetical protein VGR03_03900 [Candidatus Acidoferrum sp.]|nr:hypothetical protein [Candidatus Acidoferrum sp.]
MNSKSTNSSSTIEIPAVTTKKTSAPPRASREGRCQHRFSNGKRCRKFATASHFGLCLQHFTASAAVGAGLQQPANDSLDLSADLLPELSEFDSAVDINQFLARLLVLVTQGRISPRRASVLAYITNQLLHSHRAIDRENLLQLEDANPPRVETGTIPRPGQRPPDRHDGPTVIWDVPGVNLDREKAPS